MEYENLELEKTGEHTRVYIKVQDGCNQFCSYCIIPYTRGRVRSRKTEDVVAEVKSLAAAGYKEVVLTGIHLSSYGADSETGENLLALIKAIHDIDGIERIRLGSLEPRIVTGEFAETLARLEKMCPHFHLSLQSGCDATLKRMNRRYDSAEFYEKCQLLRKYFNNPAITTDVIVGFPGETEEEFQMTKDFLEKVSFYETHIFKYSVRKGTKAAEMDNQVDDRIKTERSNILIEMARKNSHRYRKETIGKEIEILVEETVEINGEKYQTGHTKEYLKAAFLGEEDSVNQIVNGKAVGFLTDDILLMGKN
jgi:threonylcarbamoyladenosine tRNA methylthiotransferase MtaB